MREFGSEQPVLYAGESFFKCIEAKKQHVAYLRSGREALMFAAASIGGRGKRILVPAYCCDSMEVPFTLCGWELLYYRIHENMSIDMAYLEPKVKECDVILVMNYYGFNNLVENIAKIHTLNPQIKVIEDISHTLYDYEMDCNDGADYHVGSIRKTVGVNDGGIVLTNEELIDVPAYEETTFVTLRKDAQLQKRNYEATKDEEAKGKFLKQLRQGEEELDAFQTYHSISPESQKAVYAINVEDLSFRRKANYQHLEALLRERCLEILAKGELQEGRVPFSVPVLLKDRDAFQKHCAQRGLYLPVLWPVRTDICQTATFYAEHMLIVPIDQRYGWDDIEDIAKILIEASKLYG